MKNIKIVLLGIIPLFLGTVENHLILASPDYFPYILISIVVLLFWGFLGYISFNNERTVLITCLLANLFATVNLILVFIQEITLGQYWMNIIGRLSQYYFLPVLGVAGQIASMSSFLLIMYLVAFILYFLAFYFGCMIKQKRFN